MTDSFVDPINAATPQQNDEAMDRAVDQVRKEYWSETLGEGWHYDTLSMICEIARLRLAGSGEVRNDGPETSTSLTSPANTGADKPTTVSATVPLSPSPAGAADKRANGEPVTAVSTDEALYERIDSGDGLEWWRHNRVYGEGTGDHRSRVLDYGGLELHAALDSLALIAHQADTGTESEAARRNLHIVAAEYENEIRSLQSVQSRLREALEIARPQVDWMCQRVIDAALSATPAHQPK